jgi:hypothetical protein
MGNTEFFSDLAPFTDFHQAFEPARYSALPPDWLVAVCDIQGSTAGIQSGMYKQINMVGASAIIAALNATMGMDIPYVFGGDGASFAIPPEAAESVAAALAGTREMAVSVFGLTLRAGVITIEDVRAGGHDVRVARYRLSDKVAVAMFDGGGLSYAEQMIKDPKRRDHFDLNRWMKAPAPADFNGLECRWNPLKTSKGQIVTLIARAASDGGVATYRDLFDRIQKICGSKDEYQPARKEKMSVSFDPKHLGHEHGIQTHGKGLAARAFYAAKMGVENAIGHASLKTGKKAGSFDGEKYVDDLVNNTDFQKFDDTLRMVMDNTPAQTAALTEYLEAEHGKGNLFYGTHIEQEAMITCLIFDRADKHLHFVDGARGGYAAAAKALKAQMAAAPAAEPRERAQG